MHHDPDCLFCKIIDGKIPSQKVYEDDLVYAFKDIHPWAPIHFLIVPREHLASMEQAGPEHAKLLAHMLLLGPKLAREQGSNPYPGGGYRLQFNTGTEGGQEVYHLHMHVVAGARPWLKG